MTSRGLVRICVGQPSWNSTLRQTAKYSHVVAALGKQTERKKGWDCRSNKLI